MNSRRHCDYRGRFAPSPTGPLHAGSLVAALASWLDARAQGGQWLVRMEDVDAPRCVPGADQTILSQLAACGLHPDEPVTWQSQRIALYQNALERLVTDGLAYPCACSRGNIAATLTAQGIERRRNNDLIYPGTCRNGLRGRAPRAWRFRTDIFDTNWHKPITEWSYSAIISGLSDAPSTPTPDPKPDPLVVWQDRRLGLQRQHVAREVGDFVLKRADGLWAYQLAVVVDDADQGITDVVRGEDLADNTPRQMLLQRALGLPTPRYLHLPLLRGPNGEKLSKQGGAPMLDVRAPLEALGAAGRTLGLATHGDTTSGWLTQAVAAWAARWSAQPGLSGTPGARL